MITSISNLKDDVKSDDTYNLCHLCYHKSDNALGPVTISTGLDNVQDWVYIFRISQKYEEYGYEMSYDYNFYCNLNKNSIHYKKFALNSYVDMLGDEFGIIKQTSIQEIVHKYCKK